MAKKRGSAVVSFSVVIHDINTWLDEEKNDDEVEFHDLNGGDSNNEDFYIDADFSEKNLLQDEFVKEEEFHVEEVPIERGRVGPPTKTL